MKRKRMIVVFVMLTIIGCAASDGYGESARIAIIRAGEIFKVIYKGEDLANVKVVISDSNGDKIFSEQLKSVHGFIRPYDFSQLPKGDYTICLTDKFGEKAEKISYQEIPDQKEKQDWMTHVAKLNSDVKKVMVVIPHQIPSEFTIEIYDRNDQLLYTENQAGESDYAKVFHLKEFDNGVFFHLTNNLTGKTKVYQTH